MRGPDEDALAPTFSLLHPPYSFFFPNGKNVHHLGVCIFCLRPWPGLLKFEGQKQTLLCPRLVFRRGHKCHSGRGTWERGKASTDDMTCDPLGALPYLLCLLLLAAVLNTFASFSLSPFFCNYSCFLHFLPQKWPLRPLKAKQRPPFFPNFKTMLQPYAWALLPFSMEFIVSYVASGCFFDTRNFSF